MSTFYIQSFGCRVNQAEAFDWAEALQAQGLRLEKDYLQSDLIIVNSCALTAEAERDVRKFLRRVRRLNPQARVVVTGCCVPLLKEELSKNSQIELILNNEEKEELLPRLKKWGHILFFKKVQTKEGPNYFSEKIISEKEYKDREASLLPDRSALEEELKAKIKRERDLISNDKSIFRQEAIEHQQEINQRDYWPKEKGSIEIDKKYIEKDFPDGFRSRALIKIQDGCSHACTFCLIPQVRGPSRSRPAPEILERIKELIHKGYKEIILSGIHLTSYGEENASFCSLLDLLKQITRLDNLGRIRLSSLDPRSMNDDLIDFIAGHEKICQHFHLSLQHASSRLLRLMGRKGDPEDYQRILERLRKKSPYASLGADIIVGFPGETEEDFNFLENFIAYSPLTYLHVFPYSPRPGTPASLWPQIEAKIKKERARRLRNLSCLKNFSFRQSLLGLVFEGLAIGRKNESEAEVLTQNYLKVRVEGKLKAGEKVAVKIEEVKPEITRGSLLVQWEK